MDLLKRWTIGGKKGVAAALVLVLALAYGCAVNQEPAGETPVERAVATVQGFEDVPIPGSMDPVPKESFIFETEGVKTGVLVYKGPVSVNTLATFFRSAMTAQGWNLVNSFVGAMATLNFEKANRSAIINITGGWFSSKVHIRVGPKGVREAPVPRGGS